MPAAESEAVLILGEPGGLGAALARGLEQLGVPVEWAGSLSDSETGAYLAQDRWAAVAVVTRDDVLALRLTLLSAHLRPDLPLWVTMFDSTIARELQHVVPAVHVISPSQLVAAELADQCVAVGGRFASGWRSGVRLVDDALRLMTRAGFGLLLALIVEMVISMIALKEGVLNALYFSTRSVATVAGTPGASSGSAWYKAISALDTIAALLLVAVFTAALVRRLSRPRLTTLFGARAAPAHGHVLLVGFGQVGFRLALELRRRGVAVLGVERGRCAAVAAVTSTDLVNVEVGLTASDLTPGVPLVLRLGDGEVAAETDSLLHLGRIVDAHKIASQTLIQGIRGRA
jgi:voltage-gated potassium channel Kch